MKKYTFIFLIAINAFLLSPKNINAADISVQLNKSEASLNDTITATFYINSSGTAINSAEGVLNFPSDMLSVESLSLNSSIFSIWVEQPSYSNQTGKISFNGGSPSPGFNGSSGAILRATFKTKKSGTANLSFNSANIYANDGLGTDVTSKKLGAILQIGAAEPIIPTPINTPKAPIINSSEIPDPERWYNITNAVFSWDVPAQVNSVQLSVTSFANSIPSITYSPPIGNRQINDLAEGVSYLHVRFANQNGWGETAHRKIKIDRTSPTDIKASASITEDKYIMLSLSGKDRPSGIRTYRILENGKTIAEATPESGGSTSIILPALTVGRHDLVIKAYDWAQNSSELSLSVDSPEFDAPTITNYTKEITKGESISVSGTTYKNGNVYVYIQNEKSDAKNYLVTADKEGKFEFKSDNISKSGMTGIWAVATRGENVLSKESERVYTKVNKTAVERGGIWAIEALLVIIPLLILLILLLLVIYYGYLRFKKMRDKIRRDLDETEHESHKMFRVIKDDIKKGLELFKKHSIERKLTDEEASIIDTLNKDIEEAEKYFDNRIEKIEKEDL